MELDTSDCFAGKEVRHERGAIVRVGAATKSWSLVAAAALCMALWPGVQAARCDELRVKGMPYPKVHIIDFADGHVVFRLGANPIRKPLIEVSNIAIPDQPELNRAEDLLSGGKTTEATEAYRRALAAVKPSWLKELIKQRIADLEAGKVPGGKSEASAARCRRCTDTGWTRCAACNGEGYPRCPDCKGKGAVPCPRCGGKWCTPCKTCGGSGSVSGAKDTLTGASVGVTQTCPGCGGTGARVACTACERGDVPCEPCYGTGFLGQCERCQGRGRVACEDCEKGKNPIPLADPGGVVVEPAPPELKSVRSFAEFLASFPTDKDEKDWPRRVGAWRMKMNGFRGRGIRWTLRIADPAIRRQGVVLRARIQDNVVMAGLLSRKPASLLVRTPGGSEVEVTARIKDFYVKRGNAPWQADAMIDPNTSRIGIEIEDITPRVVSVAGRETADKPADTVAAAPGPPPGREGPKPAPPPAQPPQGRDTPKPPEAPAAPPPPPEPADSVKPADEDKPAEPAPRPAPRRPPQKRGDSILPVDDGHKTIFDF